MTKVVIEYIDVESLSQSEIVHQAKAIYGEDCEVTLTPNSTEARAAIRFGVEQIFSEEQSSAFFDEPTLAYQAIIKQLRRDTLELVEEVINQVIVDNEDRYT